MATKTTKASEKKNQNRTPKTIPLPQQWFRVMSEENRDSGRIKWTYSQILRDEPEFLAMTPAESSKLRESLQIASAVYTEGGCWEIWEKPEDGESYLFWCPQPTEEEMEKDHCEACGGNAYNKCVVVAKCAEFMRATDIACHITRIAIFDNIKALQKAESEKAKKAKADEAAAKAAAKAAKAAQPSPSSVSDDIKAAAKALKEAKAALKKAKKPAEKKAAQAAVNKADKVLKTLTVQANVN